MVLKAGKKDKLPKHSIQQTDGAKYMSYLKVSYSSAFLTLLVQPHAVIWIHNYYQSSVNGKLAVPNLFAWKLLECSDFHDTAA